MQVSFTGIWYFCHSLLKLLSQCVIPSFAPPWLDGKSIKPIWISLSTETTNTAIPDPNSKEKKREILNVINVPGYMFKWKQNDSLSGLDQSSQYIAINIDAYKLIYGGMNPQQFNICDSEIVIQIPKCIISLVGVYFYFLF